MAEKIIDPALADCMFLIDNKLQIINQSLNEENEFLKNTIKSLEQEKNDLEIRIEIFQNYFKKQDDAFTKFNQRFMELLSKSKRIQANNLKKSFIIKNLRLKKKNLKKENIKLKSVNF